MQQVARHTGTMLSGARRITAIPGADLRLGRTARKTRRLDIYLAWIVAALILVEAVAQVAMVAGWLPRGWRPW